MHIYEAAVLHIILYIIYYTCISVHQQIKAATVGSLCSLWFLIVLMYDERFRGIETYSLLV